MLLLNNRFKKMVPVILVFLRGWVFKVEWTRLAVSHMCILPLVEALTSVCEVGPH